MRLFDTLTNLLSGIGTGRDKSTADLYTFRPLDKQQLDYAFRADWLSKKVVTIPARDATRAWRRWTASRDQITLLEETERKLGLRQKVYKASVIGRLYGGALLFFSDGKSNQMEELDIESIDKDGLKYLKIFHRYQIGNQGEIDWDIASPYYGLPKLYTINTRDGRMVQFHPSRAIRFVGNELTDEDQEADISWGDSVLQATQDALKAAASTHQNIASLIQEAVLDVITVPNLATLTSTAESTKKLMQRFAIAAQLKSNNGQLVIGDGETFNQKAINFSALPDVLKTMLQVSSGAADIPVTRLIGQSPAGMNATGESDIRNYYDKVNSDQENDLRPAMAPLDEALIRSALGSRPKEVYYTFNPLWQMTDKEKAEIGKIKAETANVYATTGLIPDAVLQHAVVNDLTESETYPGMDVLMEEFEAEALEPLVEPPEEMAPADPNAPGEPVQAAQDAAPAPLYVYRKVKNWQAIAEWARGQGFATTLGDDMHVTIAYSRTPIDWMKIAPDGEWLNEATITVPAGGPRLMDIFGEAKVLLFSSSRLSWRHEEIKRAGASWDHSEYQPHITVSYGEMPENVEPYKGEIVLDKEDFEPIKEDWTPKEI